MKSIIQSKNKKALSEIVAYVLLIVISLSLASGIFIWLKNIVPPDKETCQEDVSLSIKSYVCDVPTKTINITIENKGFFSVAGFFIRGSNQTNNLPIILLAQEDPKSSQGRYDFKDKKLLPGASETISFKYVYYNPPYFNYSINPLKKIQIQPYVLPEKTKGLLLCDKAIINEEISGCGDAITESTGDKGSQGEGGAVGIKGTTGSEGP